VVLELWNSWKPGYLNADPSSGHGSTRTRSKTSSTTAPSSTSKKRSASRRHRRVTRSLCMQAPRSRASISAATTANSSTSRRRRSTTRSSSRPPTKGQTYGRNQDGIKIAPGLFAYIGITHEEAEASRQRIFGDAQLLAGLGNLKLEYDGFDFDGYELDDELRQDELPTKADILASGHRRSRALLYLEFANKAGATLRSFLTDVVSGTGHTTLVGSFDEVADEIERWHAAGVADGFVLMGTSSLELFISEVIPRLERKGIYRTRPELTTFRDRLGLPAVGVAAETANEQAPTGAVS
jgi:hypothetical protein